MLNTKTWFFCMGKDIQWRLSCNEWRVKFVHTLLLGWTCVFILFWVFSNYSITNINKEQLQQC